MNFQKFINFDDQETFIIIIDTENSLPFLNRFVKTVIPFQGTPLRQLYASRNALRDKS